jgi:hypothetical protein
MLAEGLADFFARHPIPQQLDRSPGRMPLPFG